MDEFTCKQLLVGCSLDGRSDDALRAATEVAALHQSRLEVTHAVDIPRPEWVAGDPVEVASINAEIMEYAWKTLESTIGKVTEEYSYDAPPIEELLTVTAGSPAQVLLNRARSMKADVIFLGSHKDTGLFDFGGTVRAVLAHAPNGIWVQPAPYRGIRRILVPIDLSVLSLTALDAARSLAKSLGASLTVMHAFEPPEFAYAPEGGSYGVGAPTYVIDESREGARASFIEALDQLDWTDRPHERLFVEGRVTGEILRASDSHDLIVMGTHGRTGLSAFVLGNVAYGVLKLSETAVLALRSTDAGARN
ncbi:MAG: nucleotide-binding universal stress UspA family protein [Planctomycetota bacterium]|jgi:nucleotide-binding universal stress UspA family protein